MVFGVQMSFSGLGSSVNFWVMEPIYQWVLKGYSGNDAIGITMYIGENN